MNEQTRFTNEDEQLRLKRNTYRYTYDNDGNFEYQYEYGSDGYLKTRYEFDPNSNKCIYKRDYDGDGNLGLKRDLNGNPVE